MARSLNKFQLLFWIGSFLVCFLLYIPALNGHPIWDDLAYWFYGPEMKLSFGEIWRNFGWPLSTSVQKMLLQNFGDHYGLYHSVNLLLHFLNAYLVYRLAGFLKWPHPRWIFLLFLFHPANVISVAWMIQIKTLLCFLFAILSFFALEKGLSENSHHKKWLLGALLLFTLSLLSKAASIMVPFLFVFYFYKKVQMKMTAKKWRLAFAVVTVVFLAAISLWQGRKILQNPLRQESSAVYEKGLIHPTFVTKTSRYYFWQTLIPWETAPIKGNAPAQLQILDWITIPLVGIALVAIPSAMGSLFAGLILLTPVLGFVYAPFMSVTWVSDQHLYLALPFLLNFWLILFDRVSAKFQSTQFSNKFLKAAFLILLGFFIFKTAQTTFFFADEDHFYRASLKAAPDSILVAYNYATTLAYHDRTKEALQIVNDIHQKAEQQPELKSDIHYQEIENLRQQLIQFQDYKKNSH